VNGWTLASTAFLASAVEAVEALTIVLAVGVVRSWPLALRATGYALLVLAAWECAIGIGLLAGRWMRRRSQRRGWRGRLCCRSRPLPWRWRMRRAAKVLGGAGYRCRASPAPRRPLLALKQANVQRIHGLPLERLPRMCGHRLFLRGSCRCPTWPTCK